MIFNFELDLLVRLARDISEDIIKQGRVYMDLNEPKNALKCFEAARTLNTTANDMDTLNPKVYVHLRILNGSTGLIQQTIDMMNRQPQPSSETNSQQSQTSEIDEQLSQESQMSQEDEQVSQQES
jgi:hypothetical protein